MLLAEGHQAVHYRQGLAAAVGQLVLHAGWDFRVGVLGYQTAGYQVFQLLDEHLLADVGQQALQLAVALEAVAQVFEQQHLPLTANQVHGLAHGAMGGIARNC